MFLSCMFLAFGSMAEVPLAALAKSVVVKQHAARMYSIPAFVMATSMAHVPLALVDACLFGSIIYW